ncbi:serine hydrolase domain-containing protein [Pseudoalteromonas sp. PS5]|uniref:serine hydrolase domain-containing protein n=1 Tax=Pseudoalteromonas sp. PS5 TaxID=1437473 RepID=UPI000FFE71DB|nr:serine hydrolase domain-containing protein [Pseudoalteromonas sp. PS5]RXF01679.1 class A beta-lactamase-related serine hydrolase [Pseudoalteromonas sp. PS5]
MHRLIQAFTFSLLLSSGQTVAQNKQLMLLEKRMDAIADKSISPDGPGCSIGIIQNKKFIFKKSYGLANLEHQIPLNNQSVFRMASVSKQFTAFAVLLLADDGAIKLEDDIRKHLPDLKDYGRKITINSMLGHFSGLGNFDDHLDTLRESPLSRFMIGSEQFIPNAEYYSVIKDFPLVHEPDTTMKYSNHGYIILAKLIERVSGMTIREFTDKRIFKPLGMKHTFFSDSAEEVIPHRASGYRSPEAGKQLNHLTALHTIGDGGLFTTIDDMLIWDTHFQTPKLGKDPETLMALMNKPNINIPESDEGKWYYANGQNTDGRYYFHNGGWVGTDTSYIRRPDTKTSVVGMCNSVSLSVSDFTYATFEILAALKLWDGEDPSIY